MIEIARADILEMSKTASKTIADGIVDNQRLIAAGGIDTPLRVCHFMAQLAHESAHFRVTREFASGTAYEGRKDLGNTKKGDGKRYRGRGLIQTTGRANYREATADIRKIDPKAPDFEANPVELEAFPWALLAGISYWRRRNINRHADRDDVEAVTRAINGGTNGLADRTRYLRKAVAIWMADTTPTGKSGVIRPGDKGDAVEDLQRELFEAGYRLWIDGDYGDHTKTQCSISRSGTGSRPTASSARTRGRSCGRAAPDGRDAPQPASAIGSPGSSQGRSDFGGGDSM